LPNSKSPGLSVVTLNKGRKKTDEETAIDDYLDEVRQKAMEIGANKIMTMIVQEDDDGFIPDFINLNMDLKDIYFYVEILKRNTMEMVTSE